MPAFGKDGIVNVNQQNSMKTFILVKPDGQVVASNASREVLEERRKVLSQEMKCDLTIKEKELKLI